MMAIIVLPFATSTAMELGAIMGITISVIVCTAIPLTTGVAKGLVTLGIIGALVTLPAASLLGCTGGLPVACVFAAMVSIIPAQNCPLLSQAEIEKEMRKVRGG